jgi:hypothetical protein
MNIIFYLHLLLSLSLLSIPFWPINYLKFGVLIPTIIAFVWILFNGCPVSKFHKINNKNGSFSQDVLQFLNPNISYKQSEHITTFLFLLVTVLGFYRLCKLN